MSKSIFHRKLLLAALTSAFLLLMICSKSSFLYPMNDWVDVNCFFTVGRGILQGKVPYLDLYEQKGPVLYFLYALAALISSTTFTGVFAVEVVCMTVFLYESGRIIELWTGENAAISGLLPLEALALCICPAFTHGSSGEELFLPVLALSLRIVLRGIRAQKILGKSQCFLLGILAGIAFWYKYTFCGFFLGLGIGVFIWCLHDHGIRKLLQSALFAILGMGAISMAILGWFAAHGALSALVDAYFVNNLAVYSQAFGPSHASPPVAILQNWMWSLPALLGVFWMGLHCKQIWREFICVLFSCSALFVTTYMNGRTYPYYAMILSVYMPLGCIPLIQLPSKADVHLSAFRERIAVCLVLMFSAISACLTSGNIYLMKADRNELPQYRFAEAISKVEGATLLNEGFLDGGFYFASGTEPVSRYFCTFNMKLEEMEAEHSRMISEGETDFVVTRMRGLKRAPDYQLVDECTFPFEGRNWTYYLYQRKD